MPLCRRAIPDPRRTRQGDAPLCVENGFEPFAHSRLISPAGLQWSHKAWQVPSNVRINGRPWNLDSGTLSLADAGLSLTPADFQHLTAQVITRSGRDTVAVETDPGRVSIFFADLPNGSDTYHVRVRLIPTAAPAIPSR